MRRFSLTFFSLLLAVTTAAQEPPLDSDLLAEEEPELRRYTVELIVFRYAEDVSVGTEVFPPKVIEPEPFTDADVPEEPVAVESDTPGDPQENRFEMQPLAKDDFTLTNTFDRLDRLDAYDPLMHVGWTQTALPEAATPALGLREFGNPPADLDGSFTLYLSRFLHLVVKLELDAPKAEQIYGTAAPRFDEPVGRFGDARALRDLDMGYAYQERQYEPLRFRIDDNRLFKNGETRYFDHPKFGVIAKILRFEEPEIEEQPDDTEFLSPAAVGD